jgi:hypothetical protein
MGRTWEGGPSHGREMSMSTEIPDLNTEREEHKVIEQEKTRQD